MALRAVFFIVPIAGLSALLTGLIADLSPTGIVALYSLFGQAGMLMLLAAGATLAAIAERH